MAMKTQEARATMLALGAEPVPTTPEEFGAYVKSEITKWTKVIKDAGIKVQ
jgi:tripartite-type tricarboxylate transporter receptor subunit TctC